jgi:hypothetical protein
MPMAVVAVALLGTVAGTVGAGASTSVATRPVNLSTPVNFADGVARAGAVVRAGHARIEVLQPTLLRLEYSPENHFENAPSVNVLDRRFAVPHYSTHVANGWLTVRTSAATLRYRVGSGPFSAENTSLTYSVNGKVSTAHPTWDWECPFDQVCQSGVATLGGTAQLFTAQTGYESPAGYIGYFQGTAARATWTVLGAPGGPAEVTVRYSNSFAAGFTPVVRSVDLWVNGRFARTLQLPITPGSDSWATATTPLTLAPGTNSLQLRCGPTDTCGENLDSVDIGPATQLAPQAASVDPLGGWIRGFDDFTNEPDAITCPAGTSGATCTAALEPLHADGLLDAAGWRLVDDTQSALYTRAGWVTPRPKHGDQEDGYLFVYGHNYLGALATFAQLTGPAPLLPRYAFGVWYSDYTTYSSRSITTKLLPAFRSHDVPLDTLLLDTDWKAPNNWDGWEWSPRYFANPAAFVKWADSQGVHLALNVHSSVDDHDPKLPKAEAVARGHLAASTCTYGPCKVWDWSVPAQAESNFALQQPYVDQGVSLWWLDWCCDSSTVSMPGLTPDAWIDHLYAQSMVNQGQRGFVLARVGASDQLSVSEYPAGVWSNHTSAIAFTGDAWGTWNTLQREAELTPDEASIGEPYVSDDIGSYHGTPPGSAYDSADLYDRWVQLGTFQPILRLHSDDGDRLPWEYPQPVQDITESFLRLREALVPYTYSLADQAHTTGAPIDAPLYLDYPNQVAAYLNPDEFLYGSQVLVAPVVTPGQVPTETVWFPPGRWVDYFTGATFTGPSSATLSVPLNRMPVFVRAGGVLPEQPSSTHVVNSSSAPVALHVYAGGSGRFTLYDDAGSGLGYTKGQYSDTVLANRTTATGDTVRVSARRGSFPGEAARRAYVISLVDVTKPRTVAIDGHPLTERTSGRGVGWTYDDRTSTVVVTTPSESATHATTVAESGGTATSRAEPSD